ncbi:MAG TPA: (deoxy)nucleoside triphosphate pyrophosphohydrolase [Terriglobia bacterium]|nr:(deoxy)nucleoside triphosphate pyrophosphohydrolase [Terriglobia bacterium]
MSGRKPILVTAGIIVRGEEILICQRRRTGPYGLQWEFPGGKVEDSEGLEASLERELREELGIEATIGEEVYRLRHRYSDRYVEVVFFRVDAFQQDVANRVFESIEWVPRRKLTGYDFLEADRELVEQIAAGAVV